jgi:hypothetical protein
MCACDSPTREKVETAAHVMRKNGYFPDAIALRFEGGL